MSDATRFVWESDDFHVIPKKVAALGGPGSGNFGHGGRPGERGGSSNTGHTMSLTGSRKRIEAEAEGWGLKITHIAQDEEDSWSVTVEGPRDDIEQFEARFGSAATPEGEAQ